MQRNGSGTKEDVKGKKVGRLAVDVEDLVSTTPGVLQHPKCRQKL